MNPATPSLLKIAVHKPFGLLKPQVRGLDLITKRDHLIGVGSCVRFLTVLENVWLRGRFGAT